jgi:hypothetical protein
VLEYKYKLFRGAYMLPFSLSGFPVVGFSGSRSFVPVVLNEVMASLPKKTLVAVGCAKGVDQAVRSFFVDAKVFYVEGNQRKDFAIRSTKFINYLKNKNGVLVSFPKGKCPEGLKPSKTWKSSQKSGSWGSLALSVGLNIKTYVYTREVPRGWGFTSLGAGWFYFENKIVQLSLF